MERLELAPGNRGIRRTMPIARRGDLGAPGLARVDPASRMITT
jgi:hypothetical protein